MHKLHPKLKTSKSPRPDFMRTVQSLRNVAVMINYADGEHMIRSERVRVKGEGGRERERQYSALFLPTNPNPLCMIQKYFTV